MYPWSFSYLHMYIVKKKRNTKKKNTSPTVHRSLKVPVKPPTLRSSRSTGFLSLCITRPCYQPFTFLFFGSFFFPLTSLALWDNDQVNYPSIRQIGYCRLRPSVYPEPPPQITLWDLQDIRYVAADLIPLVPYYATMILPFPSCGWEWSAWNTTIDFC